ncbi:hypothetical protein [Pacificispira sp.]|uniref:hypothetical protein n=1 Tax=Pacificispira sp. TaxID=2888761 RepID=UPI003BA9198F
MTIVDPQALRNILEDLFPADALRSDEQRWFHKFWRDFAVAHGRLPGRADFDPTEMPPSLLPVLMQIDAERPAVGPMRFRYRLVGTVTGQFYRRDPTGTYFEEIYSGEALTHFNSFYETMAETRRPDFSENVRLPWRHEHILEYSRASFPLASDGWTVDRFVLVFHPEYRNR